ncbi:N-lysine methyltransferase SETD6-like isoform X2 [Lineus longissimus]
MISREGSCAQFGMVAIADVKESECLFEVPRHCVLRPETSSVAEIIKEASDQLVSESGWVKLLISLLYEYTNPSSRWRPYFEMVPEFSEVDLPMFWDRSERLVELRGTGVDMAVEKDLENVKKEFNNIVLPFIRKHDDKFPVQCQSIDLYKRMVAFVMAYSFTEPEREEDSDIDTEDMPITKSPPMMVPVADILNHIAKNNASLQFGKESLKMVATRDIRKGEEVYNTYGQLANNQLLHMYGFAEQYPDNHFDTVDIPMKLIYEVAKQETEDVDLLDEKWEFLQGMDLIPDDGVFVIGADGVLTEEELYHTLKVLNLNRAEFEDHREKEGWSDDNEDEENMTFANIPLLPQSWKVLLAKVLQETFSGYAQSPEEDEKQLQNLSTLSRRKKYSLFVRNGQRKLLQRLLQCCQ